MSDRPDRTPPRALAAALARLERLPRLGVFLGALAIGLAAFFAPGVLGAALVGVLAAALAVLLVATWDRTPPGPRLVRLLVLGVLIVIGVGKVL
ncbi:MAG: DUF6703 family protein [Micromonosporaceae bacterium]